MHVPDGIVPLWLQILMLIVSGVVLGFSIKKLNQRLDERLVPYMGVLAAVIFAAQIVNFPVSPFASGHLVGSTLLAVMVGPWAAIMIMALVLFVQALYTDGGLITYGLNLFNMGVLSVLLGWTLVFVLFKATKGRLKSRTALLSSTGIAAFITTVAAAFVLGLELQTVPGFGLGGLLAITGIHVVIGIFESILTVLILMYFIKAKPQIISFLSGSPSLGRLKVTTSSEPTSETVESEIEGAQQ